MAEKQILKLINEYLSELVEAGINVNRAFLYGSFANGDMKEDSDIDLLIVSEEAESDPDKAAITAWKLTRKTDTRIEPYLVSPKEFNDDYSPCLLYTSRCV